MRRYRKFKISLRVILGILVLCGAMVASSAVFQVRATDLSHMEVSFEPKDNTGKFVYLSDLALDTTHSSQTAWGNILFNQTDANGRKFTVRYDGSIITLDKGIWAHATSNVYYNLEELGIEGEYDYLTAFVGLNTTAASSSNGVIFWIYGSENGTDWDVIYNEDRNVLRPGQNADFVKVDIKKYKFLRLQAYDNGSNGNDHAVWADAKLIKSDYDPDVVPAVGDFNDYFEKAGEVEISRNPEYELTLLRRSLIRYAGQYALSQFVSATPDNREMLEWLYNDLDALRYYLTGGKPMGNNYQNSLNVLSRLYQEHKDDLADNTVTENGVRLGDLYTRMMISEALVYSASVSSWIGGGQYSDAVARYEVFKKLYEEDRLDKKVFESLEIEEMRWVLDTMITDDEVDWLNYYSKKVGSSDPYRYITYRFGYQYGASKYYSEENREKWNEKYDLAAYDVEYGVAGKPKLWMVFEEGSVCGGLSKTGTNIWNTWGYPASVIGQPGHAAYLFYRQDANGNGYWGLGNNISGWTRSEKGERLLLGWGSNSWDSYYQVSYTPYAQAALNDMDNYVKAHETLLLADLYGDDYDKLEEIYRKALSYQDINMDAWYALIQLYNADGRKTEADFVRLAKEIAEALTYYPLPMWDLTNLLKPHMTTAVGEANFEKARRDALNTALTATTDNTQQPDVSITMANFLLNNNDLSVASFSFDGENAGKIVMADQYFTDSITTTWEYSIDGKQTWSAPISEQSWQLSPDEIAKINVDDDVVVHIIGTDRNDSYAIDIVTQNAPTNLYANDLENRVVGATDIMEWRYNASEPWVSYTKAVPDLSGDKSVQVRIGATGTRLASDLADFEFTEDNQPETRKYIPVSHLSIADVSTEATGQGRHATNAIDGNYHTNWHTDWSGRDTERYITIKLDHAVWLSAVEYVPGGGGNGKLLDGELYGSMDGEHWEVLATAKNWANNETIKSFELDEPKEVMYVKIHAARASNGNWFMARMFNLFQDTTRNPSLSARVEYSTTELTNGDVVARLVDFSLPEDEIEIMSQGGKEHVFTQNGSFTFEFKEKSTGRIGQVIATVDWIDKEAPVARIEYDIKDVTPGKVTATLVDPSEPIEVLSDGGWSHVFLENGSFVFRYRDRAGNISETKAEVSWIHPDQGKPEVPITPGKPVAPSTPDNSGTGNVSSPNSSAYSDVSGSQSEVRPGSVNNNTLGNIVFEIVGDESSDSTVADGVRVQGRTLILTDSLKQKFGSGSEFFEFYLVDADGNRVADGTPTKLTITLAKGKRFNGVYMLKNDNTGERVEYKRVGDDKIELTLSTTGRYIISYEDEESNDADGNKQDDQSDELKEDNWFSSSVFWWSVGGVAMIGLVVGGMMASNRRR